MTTLTLREAGATPKNAPLDNIEIDANFLSLANSKFEKTGDTTAYLDINTASTPADAVGRFKWNNTDGTVDLGLKGSNTVLQIGQEQLVRVYNNTGSTIAVGKPVAINGAANDRPTINTSATDFFGITTEAIATATEGFVCISGLLRGIDTSSLSLGAVWLGGAGVITSTKPINAPRFIGYCLKVNASGVLLITPNAPESLLAAYSDASDTALAMAIALG